METRSSSIGESGGTGGYAEDDSLEDMGSNIATGNSGTSACDACPYCMDVCSFKKCPKCEDKRSLRSNQPIKGGEYTICQVRRHNRKSDCWLVAHRRVFDATPFIKYHPAGPRPILNRAGGDCTTDYDFHSLVAHKQYWKPLCVGKLVDCPLGTGGSIFHNSCTIS